MHQCQSHTVSANRRFSSRFAASAHLQNRKLGRHYRFNSLPFGSIRSELKYKFLASASLRDLNKKKTNAKRSSDDWGRGGCLSQSHYITPSCTHTHTLTRYLHAHPYAPSGVRQVGGYTLKSAVAVDDLRADNSPDPCPHLSAHTHTQIHTFAANPRIDLHHKASRWTSAGCVRACRRQRLLV